jgi:hypothetical protein
MNARYFTLAEARAALPQVKNLMHMAQTARQEILRLRPEVWPVLRKAASNGGSREAGELMLHFQRLETGIKGIMNMGITVKDVDEGLIDFLGKRNGREVYLCWKYGEDDIDYWHDLTTGFAGRQPIDSQIL